jgi:hypothetical protein
MVVWISFFIVILIILTLDLGVFNKTPHVINRSLKVDLYLGNTFFVVFWRDLLDL